MLKKIFSIPTALLIAGLGVGCGQHDASKVEQTTTTSEKKDASGSETKVKSETEQPGKDIKLTAETVVGTVTEYTAGKKIEVKTAENDKRTFDLDEKDLVLSVDPGIQVGSKVRLTAEKDSTTNAKRLSVNIAG